MAKQIVDTGGTLLIGSGSGSPSSYYDGTETRNNGLTKTIRTAEAQAIGDEYSQTDVVGRSYELSAQVYVPSGGTSALFAIGDTCYGTYKAQTGTTLFAGLCTVTSISDSQSQGDYETQNISLRSSGAPDTTADA
jgi:hypothetical protein